MKIILLEKIHNLGGLGDTVNVKAGYGRNYLIPQGRAVRVTKENVAKFEARRAELEKAESESLAAAQKRAEQLKDLILTIACKTHEESKLFGSVGVKEIVDAIAEKGMAVEKREVNMPEGLIHEIGEYSVEILLHGDVKAIIKVKVEEEQSVKSGE